MSLFRIDRLNLKHSRYFRQLKTGSITTWRSWEAFSNWDCRIGVLKRVEAGLLKAVDLAVVPLKPKGAKLLLKRMVLTGGLKRGGRQMIRNSRGETFEDFLGRQESGIRESMVYRCGDPRNWPIDNALEQQHADRLAGMNLAEFEREFLSLVDTVEHPKNRTLVCFLGQKGYLSERQPGQLLKFLNVISDNKEAWKFLLHNFLAPLYCIQGEKWLIKQEPCQRAEAENSLNIAYLAKAFMRELIFRWGREV